MTEDNLKLPELLSDGTLILPAMEEVADVFNPVEAAVERVKAQLSDKQWNDYKPYPEEIKAIYSYGNYASSESFIAIAEQVIADKVVSNAYLHHIFALEEKYVQLHDENIQKAQDAIADKGLSDTDKLAVLSEVGKKSDALQSIEAIIEEITSQFDHYNLRSSTTSYPNLVTSIETAATEIQSIISREITGKSILPAAEPYPIPLSLKAELEAVVKEKVLPDKQEHVMQAISGAVVATHQQLTAAQCEKYGMSAQDISEMLTRYECITANANTQQIKPLTRILTTACEEAVLRKASLASIDSNVGLNPDIMHSI